MLELLFLVSGSALFFLFYNLAVPRLNNLAKMLETGMETLDSQTILSGLKEQTQILRNSMRTEIILVTLIIIFAAFALLALWSFFQGKIYSLMINKKFGAKQLYKFFALSFFITVSYIAIIKLVDIAILVSYAYIIKTVMLILYIYFANIIYIFFTKNNNINSIKEALKFSIFKFYKIALPTFAFFAVLFAIANTSIILQPIVSFPVFFRLLITAVFILILISTIDLLRIVMARAVE